MALDLIIALGSDQSAQLGAGGRRSGQGCDFAVGLGLARTEVMNLSRRKIARLL
jgi:hypothetical protein